MKLRFLSAAESEFAESTAWYFNESPQAADRFCEEVQNAYEEILNDPYRYPIKEDGFRMWPLKKFPFSILYNVEPDEIVVTSVYHHKRSRSFLNRRVR